MRLRSGRIWYTPGVGLRGETFEKFPSLINEIRKRMCTPILGPGLTDQLLGIPSADRAAVGEELPLPDGPALPGRPAPGRPVPVGVAAERRVPPRRAAPLPVHRAHRPVRRPAPQGLRSAATRRTFRSASCCPTRGGSGTRPVRSTPSPSWPSCPLPLYVTTQPWNLLAEALRAAGRDPQVETCRWKRAERTRTSGARKWTSTCRTGRSGRTRIRSERAAARSAGWPTSVFDREHGLPARPRSDRWSTTCSGTSPVPARSS